MNKRGIFQNQIGFILLALILTAMVLIAGVSAETISQTSFIIKIYNNTIYIVSSEYSGNNQEFTFGISNRSVNIENSTENSTVEEAYIPYKEFNYTFAFVKNMSIDIGIVNQWANCMNETTSCKLDAASNITQLVLSLQNKENELSNRQTQIDTLTKEKTDTQNQKFLFAIGGAGLAVLIIFIYQGKIGRGVKEKSAGEFSKTQAG